ncbi:NAD-dependent epimerase/dehydratase family protein [uncultured Prochlorococcus sp.]|uniref:NAD-dependent epimerase/dehydratase family protein n=1 Tax=uncultured Prochlorococcus sp. TaxID=159733 RepID=UPI00258CB91C|nr:NAD-dependent epimerase/dehydratase family protein [uncultured Prochlorococcus sp.]
MNKFEKVVLITGCAGFIGAALTKRFLAENFKVIGIDNLNDYYDRQLKYDRLRDIENSVNNKKYLWDFFKISLENVSEIKNIFKKNKPNIVINLAAQAGVRFSIKNPDSYVNSNLNGFFNILENCKNYNVEHLVYASSSSVYGGNNDYPFTENQKIDKPLSFYAATKISNEMMAYSYSNIHNIPITGLRFFTVYGPWGRPDMAPMIFSKKILLREPISIYNYGKMSRDFTFIEDIVEGTYLCALKAPKNNNEKTNKNKIPNKIFNIGFGKPILLNYFIELLEENLSIKAIKKFEPIQPGDVEKTFSNTKLLEEWIGYKPTVSVEEGVRRFASWFLEYNS